MGIPGVCSLVFRAFVAAVSLSAFYSQTAVLKDDIAMSDPPLSFNLDNVMKIQGGGVFIATNTRFIFDIKSKIMRPCVMLF